MDRERYGTPGAVVGAAVLATCLCSTAKFTLGAVAVGSHTAPMNLHAILLLLAAGLVVGGLSTRSHGAAARALLGFGLMGGGYLLGPPSVMTRSVDHTPANLIGFALTLAGVAAVVWGFLAAYRTARPLPAAFAAGGAGAAAGCSCCMATGSAVWLGAAAGLTLPEGIMTDGLPFFLFMGISIVAVHRLAGQRAALLVLAGAVLAFAGDEALKPLIRDDLERFPRLIVSMAGMLVVMVGIARAFQASRDERDAGDAPWSGAAGYRERELAVGQEA